MYFMIATRVPVQCHLASSVGSTLGKFSAHVVLAVDDKLSWRISHGNGMISMIYNCSLHKQSRARSVMAIDHFHHLT